MVFKVFVLVATLALEHLRYVGWVASGLAVEEPLALSLPMTVDISIYLPRTEGSAVEVGTADTELPVAEVRQLL
jgi:hypothetical protein